MSTKYFCDACGKRVTDANSPQGRLGRLIRTKGNMTVEVLVARNGVWNEGEFCTDCIIDAVVTGKENRKASATDAL